MKSEDMDMKPLKKNWKRGRVQVCVFYRRRDGGTIKMVSDSSSLIVEALCWHAITGGKELDNETYRSIIRAKDRVTGAKDKGTSVSGART